MEHYFNIARNQGLLPLSEAEIEEIGDRIHDETRAQLMAVDRVIPRNIGRSAGVATINPMVDAEPVPKTVTYTVGELPDACNRCVENTLEDTCNIKQNGLKECDNCTNYRYNVANHPHSMDHDCKFPRGDDDEEVLVERKKPVDLVVNFLQRELWQCDDCAKEGRYCDADRLMSVKCTTCASLGRLCTVRRSPPLRERDYIRAPQRGFRVMCRLCTKAGRRCSWADSTVDYGTGRPCSGCELFQGTDRKPGKNAGACTTFSMDPPTISSGILTTISIANVLPAVDDQGRLLYTKQRPPWRHALAVAARNDARRMPPGWLQTYMDPTDPEYVAANDLTGRRSCEFCYYTVSKCEMADSDPTAACKTCTYLGMKCVDRAQMLGRRLRVPRKVWNKANGLHGYNYKNSQFSDRFKHCDKCKEHKRPCDRKRPCESCREHGEVCDNLSQGEGLFVADRHLGDKGHDYYVGLGYGPRGIGTAKALNDPTHMLCGPPKPLKDGIPNMQADVETAAQRAQKEVVRAQRCFEREVRLQQRYGAAYRAPGHVDNWFPPELEIDNTDPDPTARIGWPGSYIRNDREPPGSREAVPVETLHPDGIVDYPVAGIGGGGPGPGGPPPGSGPGGNSPGPGDNPGNQPGGQGNTGNQPGAPGNPGNQPDNNPAGGQGGDGASGGNDDGILGPANTDDQTPPQNPPQNQPPPQTQPHPQDEPIVIQDDDDTP
ncbi:hypothetical protein IMZ48_24585, partial [Candidatus Bathyarchaeota archaeon]|nr:hypothetical protein [Candidatus Bathyarchaeota archaeon]